MLSQVILKHSHFALFTSAAVSTSTPWNTSDNKSQYEGHFSFLGWMMVGLVGFLIATVISLFLSKVRELKHRRELQGLYDSQLLTVLKIPIIGRLTNGAIKTTFLLWTMYLQEAEIQVRTGYFFSIKSLST